MKGYRLNKWGHCHGFIVIFFIMIVLIFCASPAIAKKPYRIKIYAPPAHTATYAIAVGIADIVNKNSQWLKASMIEGKSPSENMKRIVSNPKLRKTVIWHNTEPTHWEAIQGFPLFEKVKSDFNRVRYVFPISIVLNAFITLDPKI
ncbi:MAG: hypothetical protein JRJ85_12270, partial [Deltaproteobacteria bacterium]|nr:hypothetical protein [Deltaproteobacteria bacterium]